MIHLIDRQAVLFGVVVVVHNNNNIGISFLLLFDYYYYYDIYVPRSRAATSRHDCALS